MTGSSSSSSALSALPSCGGGRSRSACAASSGLSCTMSVTIRPSRKVTTRDAHKTLTDYRYAPFGLLRTVEVDRASGALTLTEYDDYGRKLSHHNPDIGVESFDRYTRFDELERFIDARQTVHRYTYDELGRATKEEIFRGPRNVSMNLGQRRREFSEWEGCREGRLSRRMQLEIDRYASPEHPPSQAPSWAC